MKYPALLIATCLATVTASAEIISFELSPPGTGSEPGLSPKNEVPPVVKVSNGSGGEILGGITFDTETSTLSVAVGYGSRALFADLNGVAVAAHIHGPASAAQTAPPIHDFFAAGQHLAAGTPTHGGIIFGEVVLDETQTQELLDGRYYINIHTLDNPAGEIRGQLIADINTAPTVHCPASVEVECAGDDGTTVNLTGHVFDADGDELTVVWTIDGVAYQTNTVAAAADGKSTPVHFTGQFGYGTHEVVLSVSDDTAEPVTCTASVTVVDTLPPVITAVTPSQKILWPPNHKMIPVSISVTADDQCGSTTSRIVGVASDEPVNEKGDGNTAPDWLITGNLTLKLRAERSGRGDGRVYTITIETADHVGHKVTSTAEVRVPHDMGHDVWVPETPDNSPKTKPGNKGSATTTSSKKLSSSRPL